MESQLEYRPWGSLFRYIENQEATVRIIRIEPRAAISYQEHTYRDELWVALDPGLEFSIKGIPKQPKVGEEIWIPRKTVHSAFNLSHLSSARILEISLGIFYEQDKIRTYDKYGRV
jgi:mannose-6-phosphate isomerase-like protein (cupin superfamily)